MEQGKLTYDLFFELETGILANTHRMKVKTPPPTHTHTHRPFQEDNYNYK